VHRRKVGGAICVANATLSVSALTLTSPPEAGVFASREGRVARIEFNTI
jgi:hypothetical protein